MNAATHLKYMLLGGAGLLVVALLLGMPLQSALPLAILLACPLMMVFMMAQSHAGQGSDHEDDRRSERHARPR